MSLEHPPIFVANREDDASCFQACVEMVFRSSFDKNDCRGKGAAFYDEITGRVSEFPYTWPIHFLNETFDRGLAAVYIDCLRLSPDRTQLFNEMVETYGPAIAKDQFEKSDIDTLLTDIERFVSNPHVKKEFRIPTFEDVKRLLSDGYLVIANVNALSLLERQGYNGHFVLIYGFDGKTIHLHNPGLPPCGGMMVDTAIFDTAWSYSGEKYRNLIGLRRADKFASTTPIQA